jgi:hypothetical protein
MNTLALFARRSSTVIARRAFSTTVVARPSLFVRSMSHHHQQRHQFSTERVPPEDYVDGHLLTDHLEYLEDCLEVTLKMEQSMSDLMDTYDEKRSALENLAETVELDALFERSASQKALMSAQIAELKTVLANARAFAIEGPDGVSDAEIRSNAQEAQRIIDDAARVEDVDQVRTKHAFDRAVQKERARDTEHDW